MSETNQPGSEAPHPGRYVQHDVNLSGEPNPNDDEVDLSPGPHPGRYVQHDVNLDDQAGP